eukprot:GCRY01002597.1.p1 GENE.GCRY01002597.1~~GCRY01002597.1.p1  ORF type:complete len:586 (+),score=67.06 GCRY01002597.1:111-1868(+)
MEGVTAPITQRYTERAIEESRNVIAQSTQNKYNQSIVHFKKYLAQDNNFDDFPILQELDEELPSLVAGFLEWRRTHSFNREGSIKHDVKNKYEVVNGEFCGLKEYFLRKLDTPNWRFPEERNPCGSILVKNYVKSIKRAEKKMGILPKKAKPFKVKYLRALFSTESQFNLDPFLLSLIKTGSSLAFQLWARLDKELLPLRWAQLAFHRSDEGKNYVVVTMPDRKTEYGQENQYQFFEQFEEPCLDVYSVLKIWKETCQNYNLVCDSDSYVFPVVIGTTINVKKPIGFDTFIANFRHIMDELGFRGPFTGHCFRRGGAQFRFIFAKERWSIHAVKWWGGWSPELDMNVILRYLLEEMFEKESGFGDMLSPYRKTYRAVFHSMSLEDNPIESDYQENTVEARLRLIEQDVVHMKHTLEALNETAQTIRNQLLPNQRNNTSPPLALIPTPAETIPQFLPMNVIAEDDDKSVKDDTNLTVSKIGFVGSIQEVFTQWEEGDNKSYIPKPLKDWNDEERNVDGKTAKLYSRRKLIGEEIKRMGGLKEFEDYYGKGTITKISQKVTKEKERRGEKHLAKKGKGKKSAKNKKK